MEDNTKLGFIGAGNMATALARGVLSAGVLSADRMYASDVDDDRRKAFRDETGAHTLPNNTAVAAKSDIVVLAVKPQQMAAVLREVGPSFEEKHLVISIAAGVTTAYIEKFIRNGVRVVRAMPNTPMLVGTGAVGLCKGKWANDADLALARRIFESSAITVSVDESLMDAVTAISGSGPAYFFYLAEQMIAAAVELGLSSEHARALVTQTALGAGKMLTQTGHSPEELRQRVTSPGGTTEAALKSMARSDLGRSLIKAMKAAAQRSMELGEQLQVG